MNRLLARLETGLTHRIGTQSIAPVGGSRTPLVIPDEIPVSRWKLPALTVLLALAGAAMIADRVATLSHVPPTPPRWTAETRPVHLSLAGHRLRVPANMVADADQRAGGEQERLDLTLRWPTLSGYDESSAALFYEGDKSLIRIWLEEGSSTVTNAGNAALAGESEGNGDALRAEIYPVAGGLFARAFTTSSAFASEEIVYEATALRTGSQTPFAARCQKWNVAEATCLRRVPLVPGLTLTYRFPRARLADWGRLDRSVMQLAKGFLVAGDRARGASR
ncbi:hypothetical protein C8N35_102368 [Breoghania corrubedonensis]|uniref:Uncharacterized protein n=1 Tax=Breoghania corrubedonensis TaxID=665038 RepID=A0A2T5VD21_9HYPH|nr:hypothetical protein [Breoghania corrubedonensis]PTW61653.1 hypothetical protein C8N35_102368 [Breoghania corrubedonensis]